MNRYIILIIFPLIIFSCGGKENQNVLKTSINDTLNPYVRYDTSDIQIRSNMWFSRHLIQMEELKLKGDTALNGKEIYRMLVLPTFETPYCIRIEFDQKLKTYYCNDNKCDTIDLITIVYKDTYGGGGYGGGPLKASLKVNMPQEDAGISLGIEEFKKAIGTFGFWEESVERENGGTDGTMVVIEGIKDGKYHVVTRHVGRLKYEEGQVKYYSKEFKYKELMELCGSIESLAYFKDWNNDINSREMNVWEKHTFVK